MLSCRCLLICFRSDSDEREDDADVSWKTHQEEEDFSQAGVYHPHLQRGDGFRRTIRHHWRRSSDYPRYLSRRVSDLFMILVIARYRYSVVVRFFNGGWWCSVFSGKIVSDENKNSSRNSFVCLYICLYAVRTCVCIMYAICFLYFQVRQQWSDRNLRRWSADIWSGSWPLDGDAGQCS